MKYFKFSEHNAKIFSACVFFYIALLFFFAYISRSHDHDLILIIGSFGFIFFCYVFRTLTLTGSLSFADLSLVFISINFIYIIYPLLSFCLSGFIWTDISDARLRAYDLTSQELADFSLFHLCYFSGLVIYSLFIMNRLSLSIKPTRSKSVDLLVLTLIFLISQFISFLRIFPALESVYFYKQLNNAFSMIGYLSSLGIIIFCTIRWKLIFWRFLIYLFIFYHFTLVLLGLSGRTYFYMILLGFLIIYNRNIKIFPISQVLLLVFILFTLLLILGYVRTNQLSYFGEYNFFSGSNEFTTILGTAYDLYHRLYIEGDLIDIPIYVRYNDFFLLIPSQFLDSYKWSTSDWYLEIIGLTGTGVGMMFGIIAQGIIGHGYIELLILGLLVGVLITSLAYFFNKHNEKLVMSIGFVFIATKSYYIYRAGFGYIIYFLIYNFVPFLLLFQTLKYIIDNRLKIVLPEI